MALQLLTDQQISTWTRAKKDDWWFKNVYRGNVPQLTIRSGVTGFFLGGVLAATALYIGGKTGVIIGVGLTSVILSFAIFRSLHGAGLARHFTILENNCTQSIATAAGYMTSPLIASLSAYMLVTGRIIPWWQMLIWMVTVAILGVLVAFPLKRRFIYQLLISDGWMKLLQFRLLRMDRWAGLKEPWTFHDRLDTYYYAAADKFNLWIPRILGTDVRQLGLRLTLDAAMLGVGGLMGIRVATSCMLGALVNYAILAPIMIQHGDIVQRTLAGGVVVPISRIEIVNQWALWWAVTMMVIGSLVSLAGRPEIFTTAFKSLRASTPAKAATTGAADPMRSIELPLGVSFVGVPIFCVLGASVTHSFFGVPWLLAFVSLPLILVLTVICTNSMALTSWTPTGALSKITQFTMGAIDRSNPASNLIPAAMTAEIAANAANLLSDIKPGYMLGAKPRQQAIGHVIGIFSGALVCI